MTDQAALLSTPAAVPRQNALPLPLGSPVKDEIAQKVEPVEEEPYTIKCICNFSDDDGNTIYCETCDTWQHIDCFYPDNRDEAIREDFAHSCAECKPRPLDRQKAIERTLKLKIAVMGDTADKKPKRPPPKSHKKKPKPYDLVTTVPNGHFDHGKHGAANDQPPFKRAKSSHRSAASVSSLHSKTSPSYSNTRTNVSHPLSPATTPPDLPDNFQIHHYSAGFCSLYDENEVPETHNNAFVSIAIPTALSRWLREPDVMQQEVGRSHADVFQDAPSPSRETGPKLEVVDATRPLEPGTTLRWRSLKATAPIQKDMPLIELHGEIGFQKDYCANADNLWTDLSSPLPFVFFHPILPLYIDTRKEGSLARYVRRSCKANAQLDTYLSDGSEYHFWLVSDRLVSTNEPITLPWDFRLEKSVRFRWLRLLGLSDDDESASDEPEMDDLEYIAISNWIDRILSEYGGCACELENDCAFARFHRHYIYSKNQGRHTTKRHRKSKTQTLSPKSTGQATNSRATSEGQPDDTTNHDGRCGSTSSRSKPPSRDRSPMRHGSADALGITDRDKRKVAMAEDTFRRMEQQPPLKKKKRGSDGTASTGSRNVPSRNGSAASQGHYVDAGTSRSKSGSPALAQSPSFANGLRTSLPKQEGTAWSRRSSIASRPEYCDASVQTEPVYGAWFSTSSPSPRSRKRVVPLSKRLLSSRHWSRAESGLGVCARSSSKLLCIASTGEDSKDKLRSVLAPEMQDGAPHSKDAIITDAPERPPAVNTTTPIEALDKVKTHDLRVQLPPVPTFGNAGSLAQSATMPLSAPKSVSQPSLSVASVPSPFTPNALIGLPTQPSSVKKKLSLSDYTKSRLNKAGGKGSRGSTVAKHCLSSPDEVKMEVTEEDQPAGRQEGHQATPSTNGTL